MDNDFKETIEEILNKEFTESFGVCCAATTTAPDVKPLTIETIQKALELLKDIKTVVIWFSPLCPENAYYCGAWIDAILRCNKNEQGYMMHPRNKTLIEKHFGSAVGRLYKERDPSTFNIAERIRF